VFWVQCDKRKIVLDSICRCLNERKLSHCGKCPDLMCERFSRFKDPDMIEEQAKAGLRQMELDLRARK
jgi:hypothetical protein